uniref:Monooxygenase DBH like 1 n=1 Tax=Phocoena sinus TaxID=42100 RepID=A0A8C9BI47_PHOSS
MCRWPLLLLCGLLPGAAAGGSGRPLPHRTLLDSEGKYWLSWGPRGGRLAFRLEVRTAGYVGFGFSPTGTMAAADIVVGGVLRGRPYLQPCWLAVARTETCDEKGLQQRGNCCRASP